MTLRFAHTRHIFRSGLVLAGLLMTSAPAWAVDLGHEVAPLPLRIQASVTVDSDVIRLGDLFTGDLSNADKPIAQAPLPGQRIVLPAEWLADLARSNGLAWRPANQFDRAVVFRPGQNVGSTEIIAAVKTELVANGLPENYKLKLAAPLPAVVIAATAPKNIAVRQAYFDTTAGTFTAFVELPAGDPRAHFLPVTGTIQQIVTAPVLKQTLSRNTIITADMVEMAEIPEAKVGPDTIMDADMMIGLAARGYLRPGQIVRNSDLHRVSMVKVPVLLSEARRGVKISDAQITWTEINASELPQDAILDPEQIVGFAPKRVLNAGVPVRGGDVQALNLIEIPVAARDVQRGETLTAEDLRWISVDAGTMANEVIQNQDALVGFVTNHMIRTGQSFRGHSVARPIVMQKGKSVTLIYNTRVMKLTAKAKVLEDGALGQVVRVINTKSNTPVFAEVLDSETVRVTDQQTAMN